MPVNRNGYFLQRDLLQAAPAADRANCPLFIPGLF